MLQRTAALRLPTCLPACSPASVLQRMPGLTEFLQWIDSRQLRRAAVTNAPRDNTLMMLSALQLDSYFEAVVLGEECERAKPHPDPYLEGLQLLGLQPHEAIVIEDSPAGAWWSCWGICLVGWVFGGLRVAGGCARAGAGGLWGKGSAQGRMVVGR